MRKPHQIIAAVALLTLAALPLQAAIYMKVDGVKGNATAAGKGEWIEIASVQFMTDGDGRGTTKRLESLCSARAPLPGVAVEIDGQSHVLRNMSFRDCQQVGGETRFAFTFDGCTTHGAKKYDHHLGGGSLAATPNPAQRRPLPKTYDHSNGGGTFSANARLLGIRSAAVAIQLTNLTLTGNTATLELTKELAGTLILTAQQKLPSLTVELTAGQKWTFSEVVVTKATSSTNGDRPMESLSINFTRVEGPATGFHLSR